MLTQVVWATDIGKKRSENQDAVICEKDIQFYAVADGMGGLPFGKKTAEMATAFLGIYMRSSDFCGSEISRVDDFIQKAVRDVSTMIQKMGSNEFASPLYGSTLTGFQVHNRQAVVFNVGDSRVYILKKDSDIKQVTKDDNMYEVLISSGEVIMTEENKKILKNQLSQYMGMYPEVIPSTSVLDLEEGDLLCACSDGLTKMLSDENIQQILREEETLDTRLKHLIDQANENGGKDNISVILLECGKAMAV